VQHKHNFSLWHAQVKYYNARRRRKGTNQIASLFASSVLTTKPFSTQEPYSHSISVSRHGATSPQSARFKYLDRWMMPFTGDERMGAQRNPVIDDLFTHRYGGRPM